MSDGGEAHLFGLGDAADEGFGGVTEDVVVDAGPVAYFSAEELMDWGVEMLAHDVPQRNVDRAQSAHYSRAAEVRKAVHVLPVMLDTERILTDEISSVLLDRGLRSFEVSPSSRFAETRDAGIGVDLYQ